MHRFRPFLEALAGTCQEKELWGFLVHKAVLLAVFLAPDLLHTEYTSHCLASTTLLDVYVYWLGLGSVTLLLSAL